MTKRMCVLVLVVVLSSVLVLPLHATAGPLDDLLDGATDWLNDQADQATDWAQDQADQATDWANEQAQQASDWAQSQSREIQDWAQQQTDAVVKKAQGLADSASQLASHAAAGLRAAGITPENIAAHADAVAAVVSDPDFQEAMVITAFKHVPMWDPDEGRIVTFDTAMRGVISELDNDGYLAGSDMAKDPVAFGVLLIMDENYMLSEARIWQNPDGTWTTLNSAVAGGSSGASGTRSSYYRVQSAAQAGNSAGFTSAIQDFSDRLSAEQSTAQTPATSPSGNQASGDEVTMWIKRDRSVAAADRWVSLRSGPGINYTRMGRIPQEAPVAVLGVEAGPAGTGWAHVRYDGQLGYTWASFLTATNPAGSGVQGSVVMWMTSDALLLAKPAGSGSTGVQALADAGVVLLDFHTSGDETSWAEITYQGMTGFVEAALVTPRKPVASYSASSAETYRTPGIATSIRSWIARFVFPYAGWWVAGLLAIVLLVAIAGRKRRPDLASK